jgi:hypothetical protein
MMALEKIAQEIEQFLVEQRKQLVMLILDTLTQPQPLKTRRIQKFRGIGAHIRSEICQSSS